MHPLNSAKVKEMATQFGADLLGIASIDRFEDQPQQSHPLSIAPECKSVIVVGRRVLRGAIRGVEEGTNFNGTYGMFGYKALEDNFLSRTAYFLTCAIEEFGYEAVPLFGYLSQDMPKGIPVGPDKPAPNVILDINHAAHAAGLGEIGLGGFFITPQFGTRQKFQILLSDAELQPDPIREKSICSDCGACARACPFNAIDLENTTMHGVKGHQMPVAQIDYTFCRQCPNGAFIAPGKGSIPDRTAAACGRQCLVQLENAQKLDNKFNSKFRKRNPWAIDIFHRPLGPDAEGTIKASDIGCSKQYGRAGR